MDENHKDIIKLVTKPIWKPATGIYKTVKEICIDITEIIVKALRDSDGTDLWFGFTMFSFIVVIFLTLIIGVGGSFKMSFAISFAILFPIYLVLYYMREYYKNND